MLCYFKIFSLKNGQKGSPYYPSSKIIHPANVRICNGISNKKAAFSAARTFKLKASLNPA